MATKYLSHTAEEQTDSKTTGEWFGCPIACWTEASNLGRMAMGNRSAILTRDNWKEKKNSVTIVRCLFSALMTDALRKQRLFNGINKQGQK